MRAHRPLNEAPWWSGTYRPRLECLEDRVVPGETLGALQSLANLLGPVVQLLGQAVLLVHNPAAAACATSDPSTIALAASPGNTSDSSSASQSPSTLSMFADADLSKVCWSSDQPGPESGSAPGQTCAYQPTLETVAAQPTWAGDWLMDKDALTGNAPGLERASSPTVAPLTSGAAPLSSGPSNPAASGPVAARENRPAAIESTSFPGPMDAAEHGSDLDMRLLAAAFQSSPASSANVAQPFADARPSGLSAPPGGYSPAQIRQAYGFNRLSYDGSGITIAIVDAYADPYLAGDVARFSSYFGLTQFGAAGSGMPTLTIVNQTGGPKLPVADADWAGEIALDVEWAHAIAPKANILLVEANSASFANLMTGVNYAAQHAQVVSISWSGDEWPGETGFGGDSVFKSYSNVAFVAAAGDTYSTVQYPSSSPYVLSVGGTSLNVNANGSYGSETAWNDTYGGTGGGVSTVEKEPAYQSSFASTSNGTVLRTTGGKRATPDVAYDADPVTGVPVYNAYDGGWNYVYGGTSAGAPQWAALIALADQGRLAAHKSMLTTTSLTSSPIYAAAATNYGLFFHDVTSAGTGYDLLTGLGSPNAAVLVPYLVNY